MPASGVTLQLHESERPGSRVAELDERNGNSPCKRDTVRQSISLKISCGYLTRKPYRTIVSDDRPVRPQDSAKSLFERPGGLIEARSLEVTVGTTRNANLQRGSRLQPHCTTVLSKRPSLASQHQLQQFLESSGRPPHRPPKESVQMNRLHERLRTNTE